MISQGRDRVKTRKVACTQKRKTRNVPTSWQRPVIKTKFAAQLWNFDVIHDNSDSKIAKMAKQIRGCKPDKKKNSKAKDELIEENRRLHLLKRSMSIEQRNLRREMRELSKRIEEKVRERDYLLHLRAQRNEALDFNFANPAWNITYDYVIIGNKRPKVQIPRISDHVVILCILSGWKILLKIKHEKLQNWAEF